MLEPEPHIKRLEINWNYLVERRAIVLEHTSDMPAYLLLPEVHQLLDVALDEKYRLIYDLMWHTGARITEALMVTPKSFMLDNEYTSFVSLVTLKKPKKKETKRQVKRLVPITDMSFAHRIKQYIKTNKIRSNDRLFTITRQSVDKAIKRYVELCSPPLSINVSSHTFRHSFGVNMVLHGHDLHLISRWMGHSSIEMTRIYTAVLGGETNHIMIHTEF